METPEFIKKFKEALDAMSDEELYSMIPPASPTAIVYVSDEKGYVIPSLKRICEQDRTLNVFHFYGSLDEFAEELNCDFRVEISDNNIYKIYV
jgi:hypothetical protein